MSVLHIKSHHFWPTHIPSIKKYVTFTRLPAPSPLSPVNTMTALVSGTIYSVPGNSSWSLIGSIYKSINT